MPNEAPAWYSGFSSKVSVLTKYNVVPLLEDRNDKNFYI